MRKVDAPPAGWYPDPQHSARLRWWDGLDWTDIRRAPPSNAELIAAEENRRFFEQTAGNVPVSPQAQAAQSAAVSRQNTEQIISEVRTVAREELDRAAEQFSQRATTAARSLTPLISTYTNDVKKWFRRLMILAIVLLIAYFAFQVIAQASFFDWLGDRIDNVTDESISALGP
jgi:hypothetical protein